MQHSGEKDLKVFLCFSENKLGVQGEFSVPTASHVGGKGAHWFYGNMNWGSSQTQCPKSGNSVNIHHFNIHHFFPLQIWEIKWPQERVLSAFAQGSLLMNLFYSSPSLSTVLATHSQPQSKNFKIEYSINEQFIPFKLHHLGSMIKSRVMKSRVILPGLAWIIPLSGESGPLVI